MEPLAAELNDGRTSARTLTTEEDEQQQQQQQQKRRRSKREREWDPVSALQTSLTLGKVAPSSSTEEEQLLDLDDDDSATEWGSCCEFEVEPSLSQHELILNGKPTLEQKLGLEEESPSRKFEQEEDNLSESQSAASVWSDENVRHDEKKPAISLLRVPMNHEESLEKYSSHRRTDWLDGSGKVNTISEKRLADQLKTKYMGDSSREERDSSERSEEIMNIGGNGSSVHKHSRLSQINTRWNSVKERLAEEASDPSFAFDGGESSSAEEFEESLTSISELNGHAPPKRKSSTKFIPDDPHSHARPGLNQQSAHSRRAAGKGSTSSALDDRRQAMLQHQKPSGKRARALMAFKEATKSVRNNITGRENFNFRKVVRQTRQVDMETGATRTREFTAQRVTDEEYFTPMNPIERRKRLFLKQNLLLAETVEETLSPTQNRRGSSNPMKTARRNLSSADLSEDEPIYQYRLSSMIAKVSNDEIFICTTVSGSKFGAPHFFTDPFF